MVEDTLEKEEKLSEQEITELEAEAKKKEGETAEEHTKRLRDIFQKAQAKGYSKGAQKRIDDIVKKERAAAEQRLAEKEAEIERLKTEKETKPAEISDGDVIVADGKKWYSNRVLRAMIAEGKYTTEEVEDYKDERNTAIAADKAKVGFKKDSEKEAELNIRKQDSQEAKEKYPFLNDPDAPKYKAVERLWSEGYKFNPRGVSQAAKLVDEIYQDKELSEEERNKRSEELGVETPGAPARKKPKEIMLTDDEKEIAYQIYKNLKPEEALAKALKAKKRRLEGV